jgi:hypothetical protein
LDLDDKSVGIDSVDRRMDARMVVNAPVEIMTIRNGREQTSERIFIEDVSDYGCRFSMRGPIEQGDAIAIKLLAEDETNLLDAPTKFFEVIWVLPGTGTSTVGARVLQGKELAKYDPFQENLTAEKSVE